MRTEIKDNDSLMRHAKCHYYNDVRSPVLVFKIIFFSSFAGAIVAAAPADVPVRHIDALPIAKTWTKTLDGPAPVTAATAEGRLLAGWTDHFDVYSLETGDKDWSLPLPATRAACDAMFCVVADDAMVRGIDLTRRAITWQRPLDRPLGLPPTLRSGWVLLASQAGVVRALQATDGREIWRFDAGGALTGAPAINGNQVAVATVASKLTLLELANGHPAWTVTLEQLPGAPRMGGGAVLVGTGNGRLGFVDQVTGRLRFETRTGGNVTGMPALDEKHIYTVGQDGVLRAFDRGNGAQRWYSNLTTRASDGPFVDGDLVFVPLRTGAVDVRLNDGKPAVQLAAPGTETTRLPMPPLFAGAGATLSVVTVSYDLNDIGKWTLVRYSSGAALLPTARPSRIPGLSLTLTAPK